jgi:hypothetical protein
MSSASEDTRLVLLSATREMAAEAMRRAATTSVGTAEHEFYSGVRTAAEAYRHQGRAPADNSDWFHRQTPAFRDGYLKSSAAIAAATSHPRPHLLMPEFRTDSSHHHTV